MYAIVKTISKENIQCTTILPEPEAKCSEDECVIRTKTLGFKSTAFKMLTVTIIDDGQPILERTYLNSES